MRDPARIDEVLAEVRQLWQRYPDWRLGQLLMNAARAADREKETPFYIEDDELMKGLRRLTDQP